MFGWLGIKLKDFLRSPRAAGSAEWILILVAVVGIAIAAADRLLETGTDLASVPEKIVKKIPFDGSITDYGYQRTGTGPYDGWVPSCPDCADKDLTMDYIKDGYKGLDLNSGDYAIDVPGPKGRSTTRISKNYDLQTNKTYRIEFDAASIGEEANDLIEPSKIKIYKDGVEYQQFQPTTTKMKTQYSQGFKAKGATQISFESNISDGNAERVVINNLRIIEVP